MVIKWVPSSLLSFLSDSIVPSESVFRSANLNTDLARGPDILFLFRRGLRLHTYK
jgi:hypothetical protein